MLPPLKSLILKWGFLLNGSTEPSTYKLSSRAPRFFCPDTGIFLFFYCPDTDSLCCQHPSRLFADIDCCITISVHLISTHTAIDSKWGIVGVYALLTTEELFRLAVSLIIFKRRKWIISLC